MPDESVSTTRHRFSLASLLARLFPFLVALLLLLQVARIALAFRPPDELKQADHLFASGRYYEAFQQYNDLAERRNSTTLLLRLGITHAVRGEWLIAERLLWDTLLRRPDCRTYELAKLYLGYVLASQENMNQAEKVWQRPTPCTGPPATHPYAGPQRVLRAEWYLRHEKHRAARDSYNLAQQMPLSADWQALVVYRLALLQAADNPAQARATLETSTHAARSLRTDPFLTPLLPGGVVEQSARLYAVLQAHPLDRAQMLGQLYLEQGLYTLAEAQFAQAQADNPNTVGAATYAAYAHWRAKTVPDRLARLEQLVSQHPGESRTRVVLATVSILQDTISDTVVTSHTLTTLPPYDADTHVAWALWHTTQSDYVAASQSYQEALNLAPSALRSRYALLKARFHLSTTYELCTIGHRTAREAARLSDDAEIWTTLAAISYQCSEFLEAESAARRVLAKDAQRADAHFYLGAALARLGEFDEARTMLIRAADLAPASIWRERAEIVLAELPG